MAPLATGLAAALLLAAGNHVAGQNPGYLPGGASVSYNGGGYDWLNSQQLLDSVGSGTPVTSFAGCGDSATVQHAPIDLNTKQGRPNAVVGNTSLPPISVNYPPVSDYALEMNEHTLEVKFNLGSAIAKQFSAVFPSNGNLTATQLHFHSPSEHTINGAHYPLELHIVNQVYSYNATTNTYAGGLPGSVIAVMFGYTPENTPNAWLAPLLSNVPKTLTFFNQVTNASSNQYAAKKNYVANPAAAAAGPLDIGSIVNQADPTAYYTYPGTLTTPGCASVVMFHLLYKNVQPISYAQVVAFTNLLAAAQGGISRGADNRPPNPILSSTKVQASAAMWASLYPPAPAPVTPIASPAATPVACKSAAVAPRAAIAASLLVAFGAFAAMLA